MDAHDQEKQQEKRTGVNERPREYLTGKASVDMHQWQLFKNEPITVEW